jgi:peptidoglycan hydrolase-like protein with peptidoglycan-binding domain
MLLCAHEEKRGDSMKHSTFLRRFVLLALSLVMLILSASAARYETILPGTSGEAVKSMQSALDFIGFELKADGKFGFQTGEAIKWFQRREGLKPDGLAGHQTLTALYRLTPQYMPANPAEITPMPTPAATVTFSASTTGAYDAYVNTANRGSLNLRNRPAPGPNTFAQIPFGAKLTVLSKSGIWSKVTYQGKTGYVLTSFLSLKLIGTVPPQPTPAPSGNPSNPPEPAGTSATVFVPGGGKLNLRSSASYGTTVIGQIYHGATVTVLQRLGSWTKVRYTGKTGYVVDSFLRHGSVPTATPKPVPTLKPTQIPTPSPQVTQAPVFPRTLRQGDKGTDVKALQTRLIALKYNTKVTSSFDDMTRKAVVEFQRLNSLTADGVFGPQSAGILLSAVARPADSTPLSYTTLRIDNKDSSGTAIADMQQALAGLGYPLSVNGRYDIPTHQAVVGFQQRNGLLITGVANALTQSAIFSAGAKGYSTKVTTIGESEGKGGGPSASQVKLLHWFNDVKKTASSGAQATVYHPASNSSFKLRFYSMGNHADSEPLTFKDTQIMNRAFGTPSWNINIVYIKLPDGRWTLASMHNRPHLTGAVSENGFGGHLCVHFLRDTDEVTQNDPDYGASNQRAIRKAWQAMTGEVVE